MSTDQDPFKAMSYLYSYPRYIPADISLLPATWMKYRDELTALTRRHPLVFGDSANRDYDALWNATYAAGDHVDEWGCIWSNVHTGMGAIVTGHPVPTREQVRQLQPPQKMAPDFEHGFMYLRLADLRGFDEIMIDFAEEPPELQMLIDIVLQYNLQRLETWLAAHPSSLDAAKLMYFGDDLGMQSSLAMGPDKWRKYLKPCFMKIYQRCHQAGYNVFMHTDGHIHEIIPDLIECGVNIINPQFRANGLDNLVHVCKGKVCVRLDLDRQMFPFCTPRDIDEHVHECVARMGDPRGGLWLIAECTPDVPLENIEALCIAFEKYRGYFNDA